MQRDKHTFVPMQKVQIGNLHCMHLDKQERKHVREENAGCSAIQRVKIRIMRRNLDLVIDMSKSLT